MIQSNRFKIKYILTRILSKLGILKFLNYTVSITLYSARFSIPIYGSIGEENLLEQETWMFKLLRNVIPEYCKEKSFIDVGVNLGQTLLKVRAISNQTDYVGFEPNPSCLYYLDKLIDKNDFGAVTLLPVALSNKFELLRLFVDKETASGASMIESFRSGYHKDGINSIYISTTEYPDIIELKDKKIGIIKIDVEGAELYVLQGLVNVIKRDNPLVLCEVLPVYTLNSENQKQRYKRQVEIEQLLKSLQYSIFLIDEQGHKLVELGEIGIHSDMGRTNYLFLPDGIKKTISYEFN